jgi:hypothetical protein
MVMDDGIVKGLSRLNDSFKLRTLRSYLHNLRTSRVKPLSCIYHSGSICRPRVEMPLIALTTPAAISVLWAAISRTTRRLKIRETKEMLLIVWVSPLVKFAFS